MADHRKVIGTVVSREDYLVPKAGGVFDAEEYDAHPDRYRSTFAETVSMSKIKKKGIKFKCYSIVTKPRRQYQI